MKKQSIYINIKYFDIQINLRVFDNIFKYKNLIFDNNIKFKFKTVI